MVDDIPRDKANNKRKDEYFMLVLCLYGISGAISQSFKKVSSVSIRLSMMLTIINQVTNEKSLRTIDNT